MRLWDFIVAVLFAGVLISMVAVGIWGLTRFSDLDRRFSTLAIAQNESNVHVMAEVTSLQHIAQNHGSRVSNLETKSNLAASQYQQAIKDMADFTRNLSDMKVQLNNLTASQKTMLGIIVRYQFESSEIYENTTNHSKPLITNDLPEYLQNYSKLQCYHDIRASGFGRFVDPEWLCLAGQALPEYAPFVRPACECAREYCRQFVEDPIKKMICLNSLPP